MTDVYEVGGWARTPMWLRAMGYKTYRREIVLNYYHVFSEWEYSDEPLGK